MSNDQEPKAESGDESSKIPNHGGPSADSASADFPVADVKPRVTLLNRMFRSSKMWIATLLCAVLAIVLLVLAFGTGGTHITISFQDGYGIKPGDTLRFRGIDVGEVSKVDINSSLDGVVVHVELQQNAWELAREGSQFWIERPQVGLARISGLETVVGAKYIGVIPGENPESAKYRFQGIESPPVIRDVSGSRITIKFEDGHGISTGDVIRHLGIVIGEVTAVELAENLGSVTVYARLTESAAEVARAGSQFWIERPELGLSEVRGLETLIPGPYIDFRPGPQDGPVVRDFQGLELAPPAPRLADGLEVILTSNRRRALKPGVPVTYRGLNVGHVVSVGLSSDAANIQARIYIQPYYKSLVRINSRFWNNVGIDADVGVTGIKLKTDSLQSLAVGSIGFATPDNPGRKARTGDRFTCANAYDETWLDWNPQIAVGDQMLPAGMNRPQPLRSAIRWEKKRLGFTRNDQRQGWLLLLDNDQILGLPRYLQPDENIVPDSAILEMFGTEFQYKPDQFADKGNLATYQLTDLPIELPRWPSNRIRRPTMPEECLIVSDPQAAVSPLTANNVEESQPDRWLITPSISFNPSLDGACVVSREDGALLGFLDLEKGQAVVVFVER